MLIKGNEKDSYIEFIFITKILVTLEARISLIFIICINSIKLY